MVLAAVELASIDISEGWWIMGANVDDFAGIAVAAGDLDGNGRSEVIVGAWKAQTSTFSYESQGFIYVIWDNNRAGNGFTTPIRAGRTAGSCVTVMIVHGLCYDCTLLV